MTYKDMLLDLVVESKMVYGVDYRVDGGTRIWYAPSEPRTIREANVLLLDNLSLQYGYECKAEYINTTEFIDTLRPALEVRKAKLEAKYGRNSVSLLVGGSARYIRRLLGGSLGMYCLVEKYDHKSIREYVTPGRAIINIGSWSRSSYVGIDKRQGASELTLDDLCMTLIEPTAWVGGFDEAGRRCLESTRRVILLNATSPNFLGKAKRFLFAGLFLDNVARIIRKVQKSGGTIESYIKYDSDTGFPEAQYRALTGIPDSIELGTPRMYWEVKPGDLLLIVGKELWSQLSGMSVSDIKNLNIRGTSPMKAVLVLEALSPNDIDAYIPPKAFQDPNKKDSGKTDKSR